MHAITNNGSKTCHLQPASLFPFSMLLPSAPVKRFISWLTNARTVSGDWSVRHRVINKYNPVFDALDTYVAR